MTKIILKDQQFLVDPFLIIYYTRIENGGNMLEEVYRDYKEQADKIPDWQHLDRNDLIRSCIEHENDLSYHNYFSAIVCRYWNNIFQLYSKSHNSVPLEECYNWLIDAILYTLKHRSWMDPNKTIYRDPNGPDKVLNRCIKSSRLIFYQAANSDNRRINFASLSADQLFEDYADAPFPITNDLNISLVEDSARLIIEDSFKKKDYFTAFMVNCIVYGDVFDLRKVDNGSIKLSFNKKKLLRCMRRLDNNSFVNTFAKQFSVDQKEVQVAAQSCVSLPNWKLLNSVNRNLSLLRKNKFIQPI